MTRSIDFSRWLILVLVFAAPLPVFSRQGAPPLSRLLTLPAAAKAAGKHLVLPPTDVAAELAADERAGHPSPLRFAARTPVTVTPRTHGTWENVPGGRLWRLDVESPGATDLNFGFSVSHLPPGATLHVISRDEDYFQGPYEVRDNKAHGELWTPLIPGSRATIEVFVPRGEEENLRLLLATVNRGYRNMFAPKQGAAAKAGSCNNDVICSVGNPWRDEIRSVARYTIAGSGLCTGTLINNANNDLRNFFLTADHCDVTPANAASVVVYWNFESPTCGQHGGGSLSQNQSGAILRMANSDVDVALLELEDTPPASFQVTYAGWSRSQTAPTAAVGIHHPSGDEKSISFANSPLTTTVNCISSGSQQTHWRVVWNSGVTEQGSSGSGIWDASTRRLVGTLSGGYSACNNPSGFDCYGKFSVAWNAGNSPATRLRDWLDPSGLNPGTVPLVDPRLRPDIRFSSAELITESCLPTNGVIDPGETVTLRIGLENLGYVSASNLTVTLLASNGVVSPGAAQNYGLVATGAPPVFRDFQFTAAVPCGRPLTPLLGLQNGTNQLPVVSMLFSMGNPVEAIANDFDALVVPALPVGWSTLASGSPGWLTVNTDSFSAPNALFAPNIGDVSDVSITTPSIPITTPDALVSFWHWFDTEVEYDGGVLELSINGGPFVDVLAAGGTVLSGGYTVPIDTDTGSPIPGRMAWSGNSDGYLNTLIRLPASAAGQSVQLRWRLASDSSLAESGWLVDSIQVLDTFQCCGSAGLPVLTDARGASGHLVFSFNTLFGLSYVTEARSGLGTNVNWVPVLTNAGDGLKKSVTNSAVPSRFFRIRAQ
jgi:hypothetical protein